ncbi:MAG: hypothetical protein ACYC6L_05625 [Anaerolineae bacterium]
MDAVEVRMLSLLARLARENRRLLALLRLGYPLRRAEFLLDEKPTHELHEKAHPPAPG